MKTKSSNMPTVITFGIAFFICCYALVGGANAGSVVEDEQFYTWCDSDINRDGKVNLGDFSLLARDYGTPGTMSTKDTTGTNIDKQNGVDPNEVVALANNWLRNADEEFGSKYGKVVVGVQKIYDTDGSIKESYSRVINMNDQVPKTNYEIDFVDCGVGINQGITLFGQITDWSYEYLSDPNTIVQWTTSPGKRIKSPGSGGDSDKGFSLGAELQGGEDPNKLIYKDTIMYFENSQVPNCNTVVVPQPHNEN